MMKHLLNFSKSLSAITGGSPLHNPLSNSLCTLPLNPASRKYEKLAALKRNVISMHIAPVHCTVT